MTTVEYSTVCELCGQIVKIDGFELEIHNSRKQFCCTGCLSIYQLLEKIKKNTNLTTINYEVK